MTGVRIGPLGSGIECSAVIPDKFRLLCFSARKDESKGTKGRQLARTITSNGASCYTHHVQPPFLLNRGGRPSASAVGWLLTGL